MASAGKVAGIPLGYVYVGHSITDDAYFHFYQQFSPGLLESTPIGLLGHDLSLEVFFVPARFEKLPWPLNGVKRASVG